MARALGPSAPRPAPPINLRLAEKAVLIEGRVTRDDYPPLSLEMEQHGEVVMGITITPYGRVNTCETLLSSGFELLDTESCRLVTERYRFRPARDLDGKVMEMKTLEVLTWTLPRRIAFPIRFVSDNGGKSIVLRYTVERKGLISGCTVISNSKDVQARQVDICEAFAARYPQVKRSKPYQKTQVISIALQ